MLLGQASIWVFLSTFEDCGSKPQTSGPEPGPQNSLPFLLPVRCFIQLYTYRKLLRRPAARGRGAHDGMILDFLEEAA